MKQVIYRIVPQTLPAAFIRTLSAAAFCICAAPYSGCSQTRAIDYAEPKILVGNIFALGSDPKECLFKSERRGNRTGTAVQVTCDYTYPNGSFAARDRIVYEAGQLTSFEEEELQTGEKGSAMIRRDPNHAGQRRIYFEYTVGLGGKSRKSSDSEVLENDTLIDDMIPAFIVSHWETLDKGSPAKFRYIVLSRKETVGFKLTKEAETTWQGQPVVRIKMEPTSFIIARLVDPLFFVVEANGKHRILQYIGRTTPLIKNGDKWKELDAVSVFDWKQEMAETGARAVSPAPR
ncbi:MAG TPA: hypothetical protein VNZ64_03490 [Candidatus Acidoferrum sp.]|jgi:hypothetical protein|nr:hypothetical protein [Candidatus Acidoferrum sp.]